ncbi:MAG: DUF3370 family protein [Cyanobium sp.]
MISFVNSRQHRRRQDGVDQPRSAVVQSLLPGLHEVRSTGLLAPLLGVLIGGPLVLNVASAQAYVALMADQSARPLNGTFNSVPVLHSNQPEEVEGPGILINTAPGVAYTSETGEALRNAVYTFNGEFGMHLHHKYFPVGRGAISAARRRAELTLAAILINPGMVPVHIRFKSGAVRNSFEAPYLADNLMGVKPLGARPWNTGPGDATAVQLLRGKLDSRLSDEMTIPARSRIVLFQTELPALGIANALLKGKSDGPFQIAVVAAKNPQSDNEILWVLDQGRLAPGRVYLDRISEINNRSVFSRVGGIAIGDAYRATINHDLDSQGPLHVPFTSTDRHEFGTRDIQVNPLISRMADSSLDNIGTYGVRFDIDLNLRGQGPYELVMSHPSPMGGRTFTAFRGSIQIRSDDGLREVHVGLRSGESLSLGQLNLTPGVVNSVRVSMVYPADATPGHLLSIVPVNQLAQVQEQQRRLSLARINGGPATRPPGPPPMPGAAPDQQPAGAKPARNAKLPARQTPARRRVRPPGLPLMPPPEILRPSPIPSWLSPPPPASRLPAVVKPAAQMFNPRGQNEVQTADDTLVDRYRRAVEAQQRQIQGWQQP